MTQAGIVLEVRKDAILVMTRQFDMVRMKPVCQDAQVGDSIFYTEGDILNDRVKKFLPDSFSRYLPFIASLAAVIILVFMVFKMQPARSTVYAYIDLEINPGIEFSIDSQKNVLDAKALNNDGKRLIEKIELTKMKLEEALAKSLKMSGLMGFTKENEGSPVALLSGASAQKIAEGMDEERTMQLKNLLTEVRSSVEKEMDHKFSVKVLYVSPHEREEAMKHQMSMGRYKIYLEESNRREKDLLNKVKYEDISGILKELRLDVKDGNVTSNAVPENTPSNENSGSGTSKVTDTPEKDINTPLPTKTADSNPVKPVPSEKSGPGLQQKDPISGVRSPDIVKNQKDQSLNGYFKMVNKASGKALAVSDAGMNNAANIFMWDYQGTDNQKWSFIYNGNGFYRIIAKHSGKCVDVAGGKIVTGTNVYQFQYTGADSQQWDIRYVGGGYYKLINKHSKMALDKDGSSNDNGSNVQQWDDIKDDDHQLWRIEPVSNVTIVAKHDGKVAEVENSSTSNTAKIVHRAYIAKDNQKWRVEYVNNGFYRIMNKNSGKCLALGTKSSDNVVVLQQEEYKAGDHQQWEVILKQDGYFKLMNKKSKQCMDVKGASTDDGAPLVDWSFYNGDCQNWRMITAE